MRKKISLLSMTLKGTANGLAELNGFGTVPAEQLPSFVDDVIEGTINDDETVFTDSDGNTVTPESGKIYVDITKNKSYRWSGTIYSVISSDLALGETSSTAYPGDKGKTTADKISLHIDNETSHIKSEERTAWNNKAEKTVASTNTSGLMSAADKTKLDGVAAGANKYTHPSYTSKSSGLYKITIDTSGHVSAATAVAKSDITGLGIASSDAATTNTAGLMSAADKTKLDGIAAGANKYTLPTASSSTLGGVKTGSNITNNSGTISLTKSNVTNALGYTPPTTNTDTKNTAGATNTYDKIYLIGATSQTDNPQTYSTSKNYITNNVMYTQHIRPIDSNPSVGSYTEPFSLVAAKELSLGMMDNYRYPRIYFNETSTYIMYQSAADRIYDYPGLEINSGGANMRLTGGSRIFLSAYTSISASLDINTASDPKIKEFTNTIEEEENKLIELYDRLIVKSYYNKTTITNKEVFGLNAEEVEILCGDLGIDPEKYNFIHIEYHYRLSLGSEEDMKYYTKFRSLSYNDLFALGILKNKKMTGKLNSLESRLAKLEEKGNA